MALGLIAGLVGGAARKAVGRAARWAARRAVGTRAGRVITSTVGGVATGAAVGGLTQAAGGFMGGGGRGRDQGFGPDLNPFGTNERSGAFFGFGGKRRYRRMNYLNQRALKKSIRRVQGFEKLVRQAFTVSKGSLQLKKRRSC